MNSSNRNPNLSETLSPCHKVRSSCRAFWTTHVHNNNNNDKNKKRCSVKIHKDKLKELADSIVDKIQTQIKTQVFAPWDEGGCHYVGNGIGIGIGIGIEEAEEELEREFSSYRAECVALYVLTLDALNFCFWPTPNGEKIPYEHLAVALKVLAERWEDGVLSSSSSSGRSAWEEFPFTARNLSTLTEAQFLKDLNSTKCFSVMLPDMSERCRLLNELGQGLLEHHNGSALDMIRKANRSASRLSSIIVNTFAGFQDSCIDPLTGKQLFFYKRAQIAVADLWAAFQCIGLQEDKNPCLFHDIESITTFAVSNSTLFVLITRNSNKYIFRTIVFRKYCDIMAC